MSRQAGPFAIRARTLGLAFVFAASSFAVQAAPVARPSDEGPTSAPVPAGLLVSPANAAYCATPNPNFTGHLTASAASTTPLTEITTSTVYGYISNVNDDWACTTYRRYSAVAWNTSSSGGRFNWGTLINSTSVACNWTIGSTDYLKANDTADCPDSDAEYAMEISLGAQRIYRADSSHDDVGDFSFAHSDCDTTPYYGDELAQGSETYPVSFSPSSTQNRPGANCDAISIDGQSTSQTIVFDATPPTISFSYPAAGGPVVQPSAFASVIFSATDAVAGFGGSDDWDLQRQVATWNGTSCGTFANDTGALALVSGTTNATNQVSAQSLALNTCYRWTLGARDQNGNTATTITSGSIRTDTANVLGDQPQFRMESWDLGAGDTLGVSTGSGNVRLSHPIASLPIRGGSLELSASYNSHDTTSVGLGPGWRLSVQRRLTVNADNSVTFTDADGSRNTFTNPQGSPTVTYTRPSSLYATLVRDTAATPDRFTLTYRDQSTDVFDEDLANTGLLKQVKDRHANTVSLAYTAGTARISTITDPAGRTISFTWDASARLTQIVDWANVSGGIVQTSGSGNRTHRFFYDGSGYLIGWADPLDPTGGAPCPSGGGHRPCLAYTNGLLSSVNRHWGQLFPFQTRYAEAIQSATTSVSYTNADVTSVTNSLGDQTTFSHPAAGATKVVRAGTPASETTYTLVAQTDALGRIGSVKRKLGGAQVETETTYDTVYPIEPATVKENKGGGSLERVTNYTYVTSSLGLLARLDEPLDGTYRRWTDSTYNANNDVSQTIVSRSGDTATDTVTRFCYTTSGCSTSATDLLLRSTIENYADGTPGGTNGHVEDVTTSYQYDANGQRTRETRSNYQAGGTLLDSAATGWTYDTSGNVTAEIRNYASGTVTNPGDDITPNATTNARTDLTTAYTYDTAGNRVSSADPRRAIETAKGTSLSADDFISRSVFDALNQEVTIRRPTTPGVADCTSPAPPACREVTSEYDELGRLQIVTDHGLHKDWATQYDSVGNAKETYEDTATESAAITALNTFDASGRLLTAKDRRQVATSSLGYTLNAYDELGRITSATDAYGSNPDVATITTQTYDNLDRRLTETVGSGAAAAQTTSWTYDIGGRATKTDDEFTCATTTYDYRDLALVVTEGLDPGSCGGTAQRVITNSYDLLGRLTNSEITFGEGDNDILAAPTYDSAGHQLTTSATKGTSTTASAFKINPLDETIEEIRSEAGSPVSWARTNHDPAGNPTDRCIWNATPAELCKAVGTAMSPEPAVRTTAVYDAVNKRIGLKLPLAGETTYDPLHDYAVAAAYVPTKTDGSVEHQTTFSYDTRHRLTGISHQSCPVSPPSHTCTGSATTTGSDSYSYDDNDNRTRVTEANGAGSLDRFYCYDALDRLLSTRSASGCSTGLLEAYTYDDPGNRTASGSTTFAYDGEGQLASCNPSCGTIAHDDTGRLSRWNGWYLAYDGEGRLASACKVSGCVTGDRVTLRYDADGRRVEQKVRPNGGAETTTTFRYQGDAIAQEVVAGSVSRTYVTDEAGAIVKVCDPDCSGSNSQYLVTWNGHGDALALWRIESSGSLTLANSYTYTTWGQPTTTTHNGYADLGFRFLYVGQHGVAWDNALSLGLHHMGARHYSPTLGRFLQPDPSAGEENLYAYADDSPITMVDPSGAIAFCAIPILGWVACAAAVRALVWALARFGLSGLARIGISAGTVIRITGSVSITVRSLDHIVRLHGSQVTSLVLRARSTTEPATRFLSNSQIVPLMRKVLTSSNKICRFEGALGAIRVCALRFPQPVGVDGSGNAQYWVRIVVGRGGAITAYPASRPFRP
jgi:RHS repeat-associated protein